MTLSPVDVEEQIMATVDRLEELTDEYAANCAAAATAEATYRVRFHKAFLAQRLEQDPKTGKKYSDTAAEAKATTMIEGELRTHKQAAALVESGRQALLTHRARLDALRTLAANLRQQT